MNSDNSSPETFESLRQESICVHYWLDYSVGSPRIVLSSQSEISSIWSQRAKSNEKVLMRITGV